MRIAKRNLKRCINANTWSAELAAAAQYSLMPRPLLRIICHHFDVTFAPRIRGLKDRRLDVFGRTSGHGLENPEQRSKPGRELNKGERRHALGRALFFKRLGEIRDRSFENQRYRAIGLNLLTAVIILWTRSIWPESWGIGSSSARRQREHHPRWAMPCARAKSRAARSTPVWPPDMIISWVRSSMELPWLYLL